MEAMRVDGRRMFEENRDEIIIMIESIVDQKFGHTIKKLKPGDVIPDHPNKKKKNADKEKTLYFQ